MTSLPPQATTKPTSIDEPQRSTSISHLHTTMKTGRSLHRIIQLQKSKRRNSLSSKPDLCGLFSPLPFFLRFHSSSKPNRPFVLLVRFQTLITLNVGVPNEQPLGKSLHLLQCFIPFFSEKEEGKKKEFHTCLPCFFFSAF